MKLFYKTNRYGKYSINVSAAESRNKIQKQLKNMLLKNISPYKIKTVVANFYLKSNQQLILSRKNIAYMILIIYKF